MTFNNPYWSTTTKIELLERWVLVHSFLYYELDESVIPDFMFDQNAHTLAKALKKYPQEAAASRYAYCFEGFDGSTGHHLFRLLSKEDKELIQVSGYMLLEVLENKRKR